MWRHIMGPDMDAALSAYGRRGSSRRTLLAGGAAGLLVPAGAYQAKPRVGLPPAGGQHYTGGGGKGRQTQRADGTRLQAAGGAGREARGPQPNRVVELMRGAIFAEVAHDASRPFRIDAGDARIVDVGTSFEVLSKPGNVRVTVASGVVQFGKNAWFSKPVTLTVNQAAILDRTGLSRLADVPLSNVARWRSAWAEYSGAPLRQVIADLQTLSPLPIRIADENLANKLVGGRIRLSDPLGQLHNLAIIYEFEIRQAGDAIIVSTK